MNLSFFFFYFTALESLDTLELLYTDNMAPLKMLDHTQVCEDHPG